MSERTEIDELRAEISELRDEIARLGTPGPPTGSTTPARLDDVDAPVSRRRWIQVAAGAAVAGTAVALQSRPAAAADVVLGGTNVVGTPTTLNFTGNEDIGILAQSGTVYEADISTVAAALAGWTTRTNNPVGVYGYTDVVSPLAAGVEGHSVSESGYGVKARARRAQGTAMFADGGNGSNGRGILAEGGTAVRADGFVDGVDASGSRYGATLAGGVAAARLGATNAAPASRADAHVVGEIDGSAAGAGAADVWVCVQSGTPGVWRKIAGPATAGALHPIDPVRAYDSRAAAPAPGRLASGTNLVLSVKDGRDLASGAVTVPDVVASGATAIAYNLTVTATLGAGFLAIAPGGATSFAASAVNWAGAGVTVANAGIVQLDDARQVKVFAGGAGSTDFIVDITGYYL